MIPASVQSTADATARFWDKVGRTAGEGCWPWRASINANGYGLTWVNGRRVRAHRVAYELVVGPIPEGLVIDHLCRNRSCVNPAHLEPVTPGENVRRGTALHERLARGETCAPGRHLLTAETVIPTSDGKHTCKACRDEFNRRSLDAARRCPWCGHVARTRVDGTFARHYVKRTRPDQVCEGVGRVGEAA